MAFSPYAERTKELVAAALRPHLPETGCVLELGSGTGQHVAHLADEHPGLTWLPTERIAAMLGGIVEQTRGRANVLPPRVLDLTVDDWGIERGSIAAVLAIDVIPVIDRAALQRMFRGVRTAGVPLVAITLLRTPEAARPTPAPAHLASWIVTVDPPTLDELDACAMEVGLTRVVQEASHDDRSVVVFR